MTNIISGLFTNREHAGEAISLLKEQGYTNDMSILTVNNTSGELQSKDLKKDPADTATVGAGLGAVTGAIWAGLTSVALPGLGLLVGGPLAALLTGAGVGALAGGLGGALVDYGIPKDMANIYEDRIKRGEVAVAVAAPAEKAEQVRRVMVEHGAQEIQMFSK